MSSESQGEWRGVDPAVTPGSTLIRLQCRANYHCFSVCLVLIFTRKVYAAVQSQKAVTAYFFGLEVTAFGLCSIVLASSPGGQADNTK